MVLSGINGSVAVVTGAARGIGLAIAQTLVQSDARVAMVDLDAAGLSQVCADLGDENRVFTQALDVTRRADVEHFTDAVIQKFGKIDFLVNVAGIHRMGGLCDFAEADFDAIYAVNVKGPFLMTQAVARRMVERKKGSIVTISSNAALVPRMQQGAYCASKAAVSHLMRVFALELGPQGVRCNSVCPGATETEMIRNMVKTMGMGDLLLKGSLENFRVGTPLQKNAQVEDIANAVVFLLSDQAGHITMQDLVIDGGSTLGA